MSSGSGYRPINVCARSWQYVYAAPVILVGDINVHLAPQSTDWRRRPVPWRRTLLCCDWTLAHETSNRPTQGIFSRREATERLSGNKRFLVHFISPNVHQKHFKCTCRWMNEWISSQVIDHDDLYQYSSTSEMYQVPITQVQVQVRVPRLQVQVQVQVLMLYRSSTTQVKWNHSFCFGI